MARRNRRPSMRSPARSKTPNPARPANERTTRLLDPGFDLTLRPMRYPQFYEMYRNAIRNTWTVEEVDFSGDLNDLKHKFGRRSGTSSSGWWPSSPPAIRSSPTTWCSTSTSTSTRPKRACTCRASCTRRRCTCSSTSRCSTPTCRIEARAGARVRGGRQHPVDPAQGGVLLQVDGVDLQDTARWRRRRSGGSSC
jgi:hypothetical protein